MRLVLYDWLMEINYCCRDWFLIDMIIDYLFVVYRLILKYSGIV